MEEQSSKKPAAAALTIDRAAFLLLRVKKAFKKKKQQRKEKNALLVQGALNSGVAVTRPAPLLRSRTLPAIVVPGLNILQAQLESKIGNDGSLQPSSACGSRRSSGLRLTPRCSLVSGVGISPSGDSRRGSAQRTSPRTSLAPPPDLDITEDGTVILRVPAPHVVAARAYRMSVSTTSSQATTPSSNPPGSQAPLYKLARLLAQSPSNKNQSTQQLPPNSEDNGVRRLSWERRDVSNGGGRLPRSSSIDSMVEAVWSDAGGPATNRESPPPSGKAAPALCLASPSMGRRSKGFRGLNVPPKAAAILQIPTVDITSYDLNRHRYFDATPNGFAVPGSWAKPESGQQTGPPLGSSENVSPTPGRIRRGSDGDQGIVNPSFQNTSGNSKHMFALYSPPKDRKPTMWNADNNLIKPPVSDGIDIDPGSPVKLKNPPVRQKENIPKHHNSNNILKYNNNGNQQNENQTQQIGGTAMPQQAIGKMNKKQSKQVQAQLEKLAQINIHLHALFAAVEHGHMEKARTILESTDVDVNSLNADLLSPLDVAVLSNNRPLAKMLLSFGAQEGNQLKSSDALGANLRRLSAEAECRLQELSSFRSSSGIGAGNYGPAVGVGATPCNAPAVPRAQGGGTAAGANTGCAGQGADQDKQLHHWERRTKALRRMLLGWQQMRAPGLPCSPELDVTSPTNVTVRIRENMAHHQNQPIITKYKVQWSSRADFSNVCGEKEIRASLPSCSCTVGGLTRGRRYFFRAQGGNLKGWGPYNNSTPNSILPSSWRDVDGRRARWDSGSTSALERVAAAAKLVRPTRPLPPPPRRAIRGRHAIRHLFTAASKFHKNLRRGVYLACIIYHEDKVLVTNEDFLPVIEIDETYPACVYTDYHWLMKVSCSWDDIKSLRADMEKNSSSAIHFRSKLLAAAAQMQSALCIQDLGQLYHKPLRDSHGTLVISCINSVKSAKSVSVLNSRWLPMSKVHKRVTALSEDNTIGDLLMATIHDQIHYHQLSSVKLPRGLYLGYLKLQSSVDLIQVVVPSKAPNVLPHCKMRDNSHVSAEEWDFLKQQQAKANGTLEVNPIKNPRRMSITSIQSQSPTESQQMFLDLLTSSAKKLFKYMDIPLEKALTHRLYDLEVIDLSNDVSFIVICPPAEQACSVPGQREILLQRGDLLSLPIQAFEMIHLSTYQNSIINKYSKLSCTLEVDTVLAKHSHREAFSNSELQTAKDRLAKLQELQNNLNSVWKDCRWLMDVISFARDKDKSQNNSACNNVGIQMKNLISRIPTTLVSHDSNPVGDSLMVNSTTNSNLKRTLLQIPPRDQKLAKSSPGRGSWPGPNAGSPLAPPGISLLSAEFSKSEQHLSIAPREDSVSTLNLSGSQYLSATSDVLSVMDPYSRKSSGDSQFTHSSMTSNNNCYPQSNSQQIQIKPFEETAVNTRLPPSRSQDTLLSQPNVANHKKKNVGLNSSLSATSSPLLHAKPFYAGSLVSVNTVNTTNTSDSMHSISSDSEGQSFPISTSTPNKSKNKKSKSRKHESGITSSKSMSNVKCSLDFVDSTPTGVFLKPSTYLKPTLDAIQCESEFNQNMENENTCNSSNTNQLFLDKNAGFSVESDVCDAQRGDASLYDEGIDVTQKDLKVPEKHTPLAQTKLSQQDNETSDLASSNAGSRYSSHGSLSHQSLTSEQVTVKNLAPGILQVYAAYDTGLASGTSLKLHVTPKTSAREVVDLVVKQLNMAVVLKGKEGPIYTNDKLQNFCLVAVIGARERCLRDDFKPLQLQNPWRKGRLYVRQKHEVLAALEHSSKRTAFI